MKALLLVLLLCALAACTPMSVPIAGSTPQRPLSDAERGVVEAAVKKVLKDPTSPLFGDMRAATRPDGAIAVCGFVNAKNSFGGYTGDTPFLGRFVRPDIFLVTGIGGTDAETGDTFLACQRNGVPLSSGR